MAIPKVCGIETEFGIIVRGTDDWNPVAASSLLINSYLGRSTVAANNQSGAVAWDFIDEMPGADARDAIPPEFVLPPEVETHLVNTVLTNGARYYVDHAHPEVSSPECRTALSATRYDVAAELVVQASMRAANDALPPGQEMVVYKDNTDRKGNTYGCHENYLLARSLPFGQIVHCATTHFVSRQVFTGSGKVGSELPGGHDNRITYQLTQRAEHFEEEVGLETTLKRPIVNTRDEPHSDHSQYRRLHVIVGDANMSQVATFLKLGTTSLIFAMLEDGRYTHRFAFDDPVSALQEVSHDLTLSQPLKMDDGRTATALEVQWDLYEQVTEWVEDFGYEAVGEESGKLVMEHWSQILTDLETDPETAADRVDWVAKKRLVDAFADRHGLEGNDPRLRALDLQYHDLRPAKSLSSRAGLVELVDRADAEAAVTEPPPDTRAYFRGRCLQKYADDIVAANWDSLVFDVGEDPLRRVPMIEPTRGTVVHVGELIDQSETAAELLQRLEEPAGHRE